MFKSKQTKISLSVLAACFLSNSIAASVPELSTDPLLNNDDKSQKAALVLALSVEYPTAGAAYTQSNNFSKDKINIKHNGYFKHDMCYEYVVTIPNGEGGFVDSYNNGSSAQTWNGYLKLGDGYFRPTTQAQSIGDYQYLCPGENDWSGNMMNFMTMSALDIVRGKLTGGNRAKGVGSDVSVYKNGDGARTYLRRAMVWHGSESKDLFPVINIKDQQDGFYKQFNSDIYTTKVNGKPLIDYLVPKGFSESAAKINANNYSDPYEETFTRDADVQNTVRDIVFWNAGTGFYVTYYGKPGSGTDARGINGDRRVYQTASNTAVFENGGKTQARWFNVVVEQPNRPAGLLQEYADKGMRVAAMGYLNETVDDASSHDGGVLRAAMRNVSSEYDADGKFKINPDGAAEGNSGVINYVNKFGDRAPYDEHDPVAELYYTAIRYLRNGAWQWDGDNQVKSNINPNPYVYSNITDNEKDGFPVINNWSDPLMPENGSLKDARCYVPSVIVLGDTNTHNDNKLPNYPSTGISGDNVALEKDGKTTSYEKVAKWQGITTWQVSSGSKGSNNNNYAPTFGSAGMAYWVRVNDVRPDITAASDNKQPMHINSFFIDVMENNMPKTWSKGGDYWKEGLKATNDTQIFNSYYLAGKFGGFDYKEGKEYTGDDFSSEKEENRSIWTDDAKGFSSNELFPLGMPRNYAVANEPDAMESGLEKAFNSIGVNPITYTSQSANTVNIRAPINPSNSLDFTKECKKVIPYPDSPIVLGERTEAVCGDNEYLLWDSKYNLQQGFGTVTGYYIDLTRKLDGKLDLAKIGRQTASGENYPLYEKLAWTTDTSLDSQYHSDTNWERRNLWTSPVPGQETSKPLTVSDVKSNISGVSDQDLFEYVNGNNELEGTLLRQRTHLLGTIVNSSVTGIFALSEEHLNPFHYISHSSKHNACVFPKSAINRGNYYGVAANDGIYHIFESTRGNEIFGYIPSTALAKLSDIANLANKDRHIYSNDGYSIYFDYCNGNRAESMVVGTTGRGGNAVYGINVTNPNNPSVKWEIASSDIGYTIPSPVTAIVLNDANASTGKQVPERQVVISSGYHAASGVGKLFIIEPHTGNKQEVTLGSDGVGEPYVFDKDGDGISDTIYVGDFAGDLWAVDYDKSANAWGKARKLFAGDGNNQISGAPYAVKDRNKIVVVFGTGHYLDKTGVASDVQNYTYGIVDDGKTVIDNSKIYTQELAVPPTTLDTNSRRLYGLNGEELPGEIGKLDDSGKISYYGWRLKLDLGRTVVANSNIISGKNGYYAYFIGVKNDVINQDSEACSYESGSTAVIALDLHTGGISKNVFDTNMDMQLDDKDVDAAMLEVPNTISTAGANTLLVLPEEIVNKNTEIAVTIFRNLTGNLELVGSSYGKDSKQSVFIRTSIREIRSIEK